MYYLDERYDDVIIMLSNIKKYKQQFEAEMLSLIALFCQSDYKNAALYFSDSIQKRHHKNQK